VTRAEEQQLQGVVSALAERTTAIAECLGGLSDDALLSPSELPLWSRLTIACHLRYGAQALRTMTEGVLNGEPVAYYPGGRATQRPHTLAPHPGESPQAVVASLERTGEDLERLWVSLDPSAWSREVLEPAGSRDLGTVGLSRLPFLRLTEVEVHGTDLDLGLPDWGELFVRALLPMRLEWLNTRRTNHRDFDQSLVGSWLLVATDGPTYKVSVDGSSVESHPARPEEEARCTITGTGRDLLALLLGRTLRRPPIISGDVQFGEAFSDALPGP
jgi:uncharacterized protein (TIGR03083 family)